jgi:hypothetical protein
MLFKIKFAALEVIWISGRRKKSRFTPRGQFLNGFLGLQEKFEPTGKFAPS